jgi:Fe-S-cluster containining protein
MSEQRFACTACGLCCSGLVPLTTHEAVAMADRFPLAMTITPVKPGTRGQGVIEQIGGAVVLPPKKKFQLLVTPVSFIPPLMPCPELMPDNLCGIHDHKPIRCRTMPFYAYKDEDHQLDMLSPRSGWLCDTGETAPVVYRDRRIVDRTDFDAERHALVDQAPALGRYMDLLLKHSPVMLARIAKASQSSPMGRVVVSFVSFLRYDRGQDLLGFARKQAPVLEEWDRRTAGNGKLAEYNNYYREALNDLRRYLQ